MLSIEIADSLLRTDRIYLDKIIEMSKVIFKKEMLRILISMVGQEPLDTTTIAFIVEIPYTRARRYLDRLLLAGFVQVRKKGTGRYWSLPSDSFEDLYLTAKALMLEQTERARTIEAT